MFLRMDFATCPVIMGLSDCFDKTGPERAAKDTSGSKYTQGLRQRCELRI